MGPKTAPKSSSSSSKPQTTEKLPKVTSKPTQPINANSPSKPAAKPTVKDSSSSNKKLPAIQSKTTSKPVETMDTTDNKTASNMSLCTNGNSSEEADSLLSIVPQGDGADESTLPPISDTEKLAKDAAKADTASASAVVSSEDASKCDSIATDVPAIEEQPAEPLESINNNGKVKLLYEQYNEEFPIVNGSTTQANIDDVYCLSFVMPGCLIHLSVHNPQEKRKRENEGIIDLFLPEDPRGTYHGLVDDQIYYVYVEQEAEQLARDQEKMRRIAAEMEGSVQRDKDGEIIKPDDGRNMESCSCIYGNPCVDEYGCKDWSNRYAIAKQNGWKGF